MGLELAQGWAAMTFGAYVPTLLLQPSLLIDTDLVFILLFAAASQVFLFGVSIWVMRFRRGFLLMLFTTLVAGSGVAILYVNQVERRGGMPGYPSPRAAAILAVVGVAIALDAYRRWLRTDLD